MGTARRDSKGKLRMDLIPNQALKDLAQVYTNGAHKYTIYKKEDGTKVTGQEISLVDASKLEIIDDGANNWRKGLPWMSMIAAVKRHISDWENGIDVDKDLGTKNLANAAWGLMGILEYYKIFPQGDDRPHSYLRTPKIGLDLDGVCADFTGYITSLHDFKGHSPIHWNDPIIRELYPKIREDKDFWLNIPSLIKQEELPFEPHCYITSRSIDTKITEEWLDKNGFPKVPVYSIGHDQSKVGVAKESGLDIYVDDRWENFVELNNAGICCFLYDAPYNQKHDVGFKRIYSLKDLV